MTDRIGTCSLCGGAVIPAGYMHQTHCRDCGAIPRYSNDPAPVIPMEQPRMPRPAHLTWIEDSLDPAWDAALRISGDR